MKEKLELVTDFASLRTGMIIVCNHGWCGRKHRHILLAHTQSDWGEPGFFVAPPVPCRSGVDAIGKRAVDRRSVFRVVDNLEQTTESRKSVTA